MCSKSSSRFDTSTWQIRPCPLGPNQHGLSNHSLPPCALCTVLKPLGSVRSPPPPPRLTSPCLSSHDHPSSEFWRKQFKQTVTNRSGDFENLLLANVNKQILGEIQGRERVRPGDVKPRTKFRRVTPLCAPASPVPRPVPSHGCCRPVCKALGAVKHLCDKVPVDLSQTIWPCECSKA